MPTTTNESILKEMASIAGYGEDESETYYTKMLRAMNKAIRHICRQRFLALRTTDYIHVTENRIEYDLLDEMCELDNITICSNQDYTGSVTTWATDTSASHTGHFDAAVESEVGDGSVVQIGKDQFLIESLTGDGTAADSVELNYTPTDTDVVFIGDEDDGDKAVVHLLPASYDDIYEYTAGSTRSYPLYYHVEDYDTSNHVQKILIGKPHADGNYLVEVNYFPYITELTSSAADLAAVNRIVRLYGEEPIVAYGMFYYFNSLKQPDLATQWLGIAKVELSGMWRRLPRRDVGGYFA